MGGERESGGRLEDWVNQALDNASTSWDREKRSPGYQEIREVAIDLRDKLRARRRTPEIRQAPFTEMAYDAAGNLADAVAYLLDEPLEIGRVAPENHQGSQRAWFVDQIATALNHLGLNGNAVKETLEQEGDI